MVSPSGTFVALASLIIPLDLARVNHADVTAWWIDKRANDYSAFFVTAEKCCNISYWVQDVSNNMDDYFM